VSEYDVGEGRLLNPVKVNCRSPPEVFCMYALALVSNDIAIYLLMCLFVVHISKYMKKLNPPAQKTWTKIVVLFDNLEVFKDRFPEPRTKRQEDIIKLFESQIVNETNKLKEQQ